MPEGDTISRTAATLRRALSGQRVVRFESVFPSVSRIDEDHHIVGRRIDTVVSQGKHVLMRFGAPPEEPQGHVAPIGSAIVLRSHLRMHGSWHVYRPGERWQRPRARMRVLVETETFVAVAFDVHDVEASLVRDPIPTIVQREPAATAVGARALHPPPEVGRAFRATRRLGPDLLAPLVDLPEIVRRARTSSHQTLAEVLLDQRVAAGVGNVIKSEVLFLAKLSPFARPGRLEAEAWRSVYSIAAKILGRNSTLAGPRRRGGRNTTGRLQPSAELWVYGRAGRPCRVCGASIEGARSTPAGRSTYWCPRCQLDPPEPEDHG